VIAHALRVWRALVASMTRASRRRLRPTTSGRWLLFMAFAVGFAAMNTGNNLLFFGWGLVLSAIVISGILSESTLQAATPTLLPPDELRALREERLPVALHNERRVPAFGVEVSLALRPRGAAAWTAATATATTKATTTRTTQQQPAVEAMDGGDVVRTGATFELRLSPGASRTSRVPWTPLARGVVDVESLRVATAAPFGFFSKERIFDPMRLPPALRSLTVLPARVDTRALGHALWARLGEQPAGRAGNGDEVFSLRPYRAGDDPRRIAWRRAAKTGRIVVREHEATQSRELLVDLRIGSSAADDDVEDAVATAASLVEDLLEDGHSVGVRACGLLVSPARSPRQRDACLRALATLEAKTGPLPTLPRGGHEGVVAVVVGGADTDGADVVVTPLARGAARSS
jgi:uncharacterized protein (DUF58 family)